MADLHIKGASEQRDQDGHAYIVLSISEWPQPIWIPVEQERMARDNGWVYMGAQYDFLPILVVPANPPMGIPQPFRVKGFTDDQAVVYLVNRADDRITTEHEFGGEIGKDDLMEAFSAREEDPMVGRNFDINNPDAFFGTGGR
jgi:hypothetical protein